MKIIIDFETCNLSQRHPIQIGLLVVNDDLKEVFAFESLIKLLKNSQWDEKAEAVHGISKSKLKHAPDTELVGLAIAGIFKMYESPVHNVQLCWHAQSDFDLKILNELMMRAGTIGRGMPIKYEPYNTMKQARKHNLYDSYSLPNIMKVLEYEYDAHDALSDCRATLRLMQELRKYD